MQATKKQVLLSEAALLLAGLIWGSGFVVMKNALSVLPAGWLLCIRFAMAAVVLLAFSWKKLRRLDRYTLISALVCGAFLFAGYYVQTVGLAYTTVGNNAFITSIYVVLVPLFHWAVSRKKPGTHAVIAAAVCLAGVGIIALQGGFHVNIGDLLTLLCGMLYAVHIVAVAHFSEKPMDMYVFTGLQFLFCALFSGIVGALAEPFPAASILFSKETAVPMLYLGLGCTLLALTMENVALKYAPPAHASLLMSTEAPFGFLAGILFLHEPFTLRFLIGAALIAGSIVLSELGHKLTLRRAQAAEIEPALAEQEVGQ